ncbi:hypothetical protein [Aeoliella sp. SH292]|uniref:hypothetical protein n=1 Tax=Aeoliella sp. SH292 TaxID=3454464 RepID=UPI003F98DE13
MSIDAMLRRFGGFNGAVVQAIDFCTSAGKIERTATIHLLAFDEEAVSKDAWTQVRVAARGGAVFSWIETSRLSNLALNWPVTQVVGDGMTFIDFDPLHPAPTSIGPILSHYFIGGREISIEVVDVEFTS